jgi:hypothetical protein
MRRRLPRALLIVVGMLIVLIAFLGVGAVTMGNDLVCSTAERRAMSEFPQFDGAEPSWESNLKISGGCTTSYTVQAAPEEVRAYYRGRLEQSEWMVQVGPANSFPIHLEAERDGLRYFLMFERSRFVRRIEPGTGRGRVETRPDSGIDLGRPPSLIALSYD